MITIQNSFLLLGIAFLISTMVFPFVLAFARKHNIVDNPSARKLQRVPVPVMGGTVVFIGVLVTAIVDFCIFPNPNVIKLLALLFVMYAIGVWDDIKDVSPSLRFIIELLVVWMMILLLGAEINDCHGLWGINVIPDAVSVPFSLIAGVGIMNAVNLIDGVDGYCSTYGVMSCSAFAIIFLHAGDMTMFAMALISIGAVIPFFFHNVFGKTSKMFLGDGGSLMLGTLLAFFAFKVLSKDSLCARFDDKGISLVALSLAILAVPVFDTLRVMIFRIVRGQSPFHPDKTHLHHLFIDMNFSHLATSGVIVFGNVLIIGVLWLSWKLGANVNWQTYFVIAAALLFTWGFYFLMEWQHRKNNGEGSKMWNRWSKRGKITNISSTPSWQFIRSIVDSKFFGGGFLLANQDDDREPVDESRPDPRVM